MDRAPMQILVVDDESDMCWALETVLCAAGYAVTTATSAEEAQRLARGQQYAAAFVDAKIPDMDGLELAGLLHEQHPHIAVVLISGYFYQEDNAVTEALDTGVFVDFVAKPFDLESVRAAARRAVDRFTQSLSENQ